MVQCRRSGSTHREVTSSWAAPPCVQVCGCATYAAGRVLTYVQTALLQYSKAVCPLYNEYDRLACITGIDMLCKSDKPSIIIIITGIEFGQSTECIYAGASL